MLYVTIPKKRKEYTCHEAQILKQAYLTVTKQIIDTLRKEKRHCRGKI